jgi:hypothetical protein
LVDLERLRAKSRFLVAFRYPNPPDFAGGFFVLTPERLRFSAVSTKWIIENPLKAVLGPKAGK